MLPECNGVCVADDGAETSAEDTLGDGCDGCSGMGA